MTEQWAAASISLPLDGREVNLLLNKTPVLSHGTDIDSKSHLVLNEKDSPPYHPCVSSNWELSSVLLLQYLQRHQNQRNKEREKKNLLASISVQY